MKNTPLLVSIILPTFNERENIVDLVKAIDTEVSFPHEIIVVDDNSPDGTATAVTEYQEKTKNKNIRVEVRTRNPGLTNSIQHGIDVAKGSILVWLDADFSMPPSVIPLLIHKVEDGADISVASKYHKGGKTKKIDANSKESTVAIVLSFVLNKTLAILFHIPVTDFTSGFIAVKKDVLHHIRLKGDYGEYFINFVIAANRHGYSIVEIPYVCQPRWKGESKTGSSIPVLFRRGIKYVKTVYENLTTSKK